MTDIRNTSLGDENVSIVFSDVRKVYRLYENKLDHLIDLFGFSSVRSREQRFEEFVALNGINLTIHKGEQLGVIGRNGAGKTTLLKLLLGIFSPTSGHVTTNGQVHALMATGLGFHPEFTGFENIESALLYSGLTEDKLAAAVEDVVEFVELDRFLHQPVKTYSQGMRARLMFAAATAIDPEILIVDEILGAGDAYFTAKSRQRMKRLAASGCTLLLVSHSMQQVLEMCETTVWIDQGEVIMRGDSIDVVKAYEQHLAALQTRGAEASIKKQSQSSWVKKVELDVVDEGTTGVSKECDAQPTPDPTPENPKESAQKQPAVVAADLDSPKKSLPKEVQRVLEDGKEVSYWPSESGVKVAGFKVVCDGQESSALMAHRAVSMEILTKTEHAGEFAISYNLNVYGLDGKRVVRMHSPADHYSAAAGEYRTAKLLFSPLLLGPGDYMISLALFDDTPLAQIQNATRYDLLSRSFSFRVLEHSGVELSRFYHPCEWNFSANQEVRCA